MWKLPCTSEVGISLWGCVKLDGTISFVIPMPDFLSFVIVVLTFTLIPVLLLHGLDSGVLSITSCTTLNSFLRWL
jgi:hypothetical protein